MWNILRTQYKLSLSTIVFFVIHANIAVGCGVSNIKVSIHSRTKIKGDYKIDSRLTEISFCCYCTNPNLEGSHVEALIAANGPQVFNVSSGIKFAVPNHGDKMKFVNSREIRGMIAVVIRGRGVAIVDKVMASQHSGAVGAIIIDDGKCEQGLLNSCRSANKGEFGAHDDWSNWGKIKIPALLVTQTSGEKLKRLMQLKVLYLKGYGEQFVTLNEEHDYDRNEF